MKKNSNLGFIIASIVVAILAFAALCYGYGLVGEEVKAPFRFNNIFFWVGIIIYIALVLVCYLMKKSTMVVLIPTLILFVTTSLTLGFVSSALSNGGESQNTSVLSILVTGFLVVSLVFAFKGKKWAAITAIVLLALNIYGNYAIVSGVAGLRTALPSSAETLNDTYLGLEHMIFSNIATYASLIVYFVGSLVKKVEAKETEEVSE